MTVKFERLYQLAQHVDFSVLIPPLVILPADEALAITAVSPQADADLLRTIYSKHITEQHGWVKQVVEVCGPPPWIVRSAGLEDGDAFVNAGGYASVICHRTADFAETVAEVTFSGFEPQAIAQQRLINPDYQPQPIACFVQRLIEGIPSLVEPLQAPYLTADVCHSLYKIILQLHQYFSEVALDTEWVLETDHGLVSATGLTLAAPDGIRGELAFGFGFASAQSPGSRVNSVAYHWPRLAAPLWYGTQLRQVHADKLWLVQVRPAPGYTLERRVQRLTAEVRTELARCMRAVPVTALLHPVAPSLGSFLSASTLDDAWSRYLRLPPSVQTALTAVFVESGVACEHAGIMFRQQKLPVFLTQLTNLPAVPWVVIDGIGELAYFSAQKPLIVLKTETAESVNLPALVQRVFDDSESLPIEVLTSQRITDLLQNALTGLPMLTEKAYTTLKQRTTFPTDTWLQKGNVVRSPSLTGWLLAQIGEKAIEFLPSHWLTADATADYFCAFTAKSNPQSALPRLCKAIPTLADRIIQLNDLRLLMQLIKTEAWIEKLPSIRLASWIDAAITAPYSDAHRLLECILHVLADTEMLPIYEDADRLNIVHALVGAAKYGLSPVSLLEIIHYNQLAPIALASLVCAPKAFAAYLAFLAPLKRFKVAAALAGASEAADLLQATASLMKVLHNANLPTLKGLCRIDLVDAYDQVLKAVLADVVDRRDLIAYQRYLDLLSGWIAFAQLSILSATEKAALRSFLRWIERARHQSMPDNFFLELKEDIVECLGDDFLRWQVLIPIAGNMDPGQLPIENAHQLHNLLHQWMLARFRTGSGSELPALLRKLINIADGFGDARSCLLRLTRNILEISLPFVVHKASFLFNEKELIVEFAELPNAPEEDIGRLHVFEALALRIVEWEPIWRVSLNRVCQLGTWTLFLRMQRTDGADWQAKDLHQLVLWLRVLFDTAYDFSYVPNDDVSHVYEMVGHSPWRELFRAYATYRAAIDFSTQRITVYSLPFATTLAALCLNQSVRDEVTAACIAGFESAWKAFHCIVEKLERAETDQNQWGILYTTAGQLGLLLSAMWPEQTLMRMAQAPLSPVAAERMGVSLLHRRDLAATLQQLITVPENAALRDLVLHHIPEIAVSASSASTIADEVTSWQSKFKRCKEYLLAHHANLLSDSQCRQCVKQLGLVPYGITEEIETSIQRALAHTAAEVKGRFKLDEVDPIVIIRAIGTETGASVLQCKLGSLSCRKILGEISSISVNYIRQLIIKVACDTTGDNAEELIERGRLEIPPRDAIEFVVRLEALFDCTLGWLRYEPLSIEINEFSAVVNNALNARVYTASTSACCLCCCHRLELRPRL
ncbi:hypothetical protein BB987_20735 [Photorhabdus temperata]|uniref:Pyruvate phosphate dikinase-like protein n=1 Tax=Photorhabdus khanii NC19 TaxID=1004151 RepID=W3V1I7_9GAMM|nr:DUF6137 domain-containing protein [Photorhabdus khanii]ETS29806.1 pyruvate phosphate dikinase-like protein [Photorhabdus khanii NC19]OHV58743.1 hypothetical protein BB987_20735 [Photorhabdus temperata]